MFIKQIYTKCLAQASYYIESEGEVVIIDPIRDIDEYVNLINTNNSKLKYILETHLESHFRNILETFRAKDNLIEIGEKNTRN